MPVEVNASVSNVAGCLASADGTEQGSRSRSMGPDGPEVQISAVSGGIEVRHDLSHACCLRSKISTEVKAGNVIITESLSGTPCRCMCSSTVTTKVRLGPGAYSLKVVLDDRGQQKTALEQKLDVK